MLKKWNGEYKSQLKCLRERANKHISKNKQTKNQNNWVEKKKKGKEKKNVSALTNNKVKN